MHSPLTNENLEEQAARAVGTMNHRDMAEQMLTWSESLQRDDEVTVADLLVGAGEQFSLAGEHTKALDAYQRATACEETTSPDARGYVVTALLNLGLTSEAEKASAELRRSRPETSVTHHMVGEAWEAAGRLDEANRWLTTGALLAERQGAKMDWALLLIGRLRVRRALGFPPDDYDHAAAEVTQESRAKLGPDAHAEDEAISPVGLRAPR